jgi:outer membrane protein TolC
MNARQRLAAGLAAAAIAAGAGVAQAQAPAGRPTDGLEDVRELIAGEQLRFNLQQLVVAAGRRNAQAIFQELGWRVAEETVNAERALYDPSVSASIGRNHLNRPNNAAEFYDQSFRNTFRERANEARAGLDGLLPTGARWSVEYRYVRRENDLVRQRYQDQYRREYESEFEIALRQPLLKDAGNAITTTRLRVAELEREIAFQRYRQRMLEVAGGAVAGYWDVFLAQGLRDMRQESVAVAERVLAGVEAQAAAGRAARTEVLEARAGLTQRRSELLSARLELVSAASRIRGLLNLGRASHPLQVAAVDPRFSSDDIRVSVDDSLSRALDNWPEYIITDLSNRQDRLRLDHAQNQEKPQLDARFSVGTTGLAVDAAEALSESRRSRFPSFTVGLEFRRPLQNTQAEANTRAAAIRAQQSKLERGAAEQAIANTLLVRAERVDQLRGELRELMEASSLRRVILETEIERLQQGRSRVRDVLIREEDLIAARLAELKTRAEFERSIAALQLAEGTLLDRYGVRLRLSDADDAR